jgi:ribosomal protein S27AE
MIEYGKVKLRRPCKRCGKRFIPTGRDSWLCSECFSETHRHKNWRKKSS